jgi:hypothetical protein
VRTSRAASSAESLAVLDVVVGEVVGVVVGEVVVDEVSAVGIAAAPAAPESPVPSAHAVPPETTSAPAAAATTIVFLFMVESFPFLRNATNTAEHGPSTALHDG